MGHGETMTLVDMADVLADAERREHAAQRRQVRRARRQAAARRADLLYYRWAVRRLAKRYRERATLLRQLAASVERIHEATRTWASWQPAPISGPYQRLLEVTTALERHATAHAQAADRLMGISIRLDALRVAMRRREARRFRRTS
jgi:hypothetical protein